MAAMPRDIRLYAPHILWGLIASAALLLVYGIVLSAVSGFSYALSQFGQFWGFVVSLALGFGIQVGLYRYLRSIIVSGRAGRGVLGVTGTTSTAAMVSCCTHYLVNILPVLGAAGIVTFVAQYQAELFWIGIVFNVAGIAYIMRIIRTITRI